ncbi:MAG: hypothetical protein A2V69_00390 [Candidatus Portnoybacteria bacterium RBG_13_40_8]|uniref:Uncharacterized protein n=1 Tax=Candidatus Portnoybacteria bacterium RBG_13_40_8 TaxID=1801990 RepID=A0A1G2F1J9_9BACT|nr:MAG: hypothetical protein A2V69_00390 [Candidatus Portnoybacteria bacterium RBG_13_40_8]
MKNKSLKVFVACALGAGIGSLTALQLGIFWWLGLLVGGFVGYVSYEFKAVLRAMASAWKTAVKLRPHWKNFWMLFASFLSVSLWILLPFAMVSLVVSDKVLHWGLLGMTTGAIVFGFVFGLAFALDQSSSAQTNAKETFDMLVKKGSPISVFFYWLPKGIIWVIIRIPKAVLAMIIGLVKLAKLMTKFIKTIFITIHSEIRLLCGVDAAIGTAIGYFAGNAIIGAIAGGLFGLLNYEVVSRRILRLVPVKATPK